MRFPLKRISPPVIGCTPERARSSVVFPAPFAPTRATTSPLRTSRLTPFRTSMRPYALRRFSTSSTGTLPGAVPSQISLKDLWIIAHLPRRSLGQRPASLQNQDPVGDLHDELHIMLDENDRDTSVGNLPDQVIDLLGLDRIAPGSRLVEE